MEFCPRGNLKDLLQESRAKKEPHQQYTNIYSSLTERQLINFAAEIARGMDFLFKKKVNIIHNSSEILVAYRACQNKFCDSSHFDILNGFRIILRVNLIFKVFF